MIYKVFYGYLTFAFLHQGLTGHMQVRLVNGTAWSGRLEIFHDGKWKTMCKPCIDETDLQVVCRSLGFESSGAVTVRSDLYGQGSGFIFRKHLKCSGGENSLSECETGSTYYCEHWMDVGVICNSPGELTPRLVNGAHGSGRLKILENRVWNTVCDQEFGNKEAQVVCRMLGLNSFGAVSMTSDMYGVGTGYTLSVKMICTGAESKLSECKKLTTYDCNHSTDVGVICNIPGQITPRLVEGNVSSCRLEILHNGTWSSVCDEGFGLEEAEVACRMLGFDSPGKASVMSLFYGNNSTRTISGNMTCRGTEESLAECEHQGFYTSDCEQSHVVGISCSVPADHALRLANGNLWSGRLEIFYNQRWRPLCDRDFGEKEAQVVCGMLNYSSPGAVPEYPGTYGSGSESVWLANVKCAGTETSLLRCTHDGLYEEVCGPLEDIAVICNIPGQFVPRLAEGTAWSGRLQLLYNGIWSSVCDDGFGHKEARVACRMLGFDSSDVFAVNSFLFKDHDGTVLFSDLHCQGTETHLAQCNYSSLYNHKCIHGSDIALICKVETGDIRLTGNYGTTYGVGRVEMRMQSEWYSVCGTGFSSDDARVVCRQLGFNGSTATTADVSLFGVRQIEVVVVDFSCSGNETSMFICLQRVKSIRDLCDTEEFGVICGEYPPSFITFSLNDQVGPTVTVTENSTVDMLCEAHGRPTPRMLFITDKDNNILIDSKQDEVHLLEGKKKITMILRNVQCEDSANYRCKVDNGVGQSNQSIQLLVPCVPRLKHFYKQPPFAKISNHKGNLSFEMTAYPAPRVKFIVHHGSTVKDSVNILSVEENVQVECVEGLFAPALHTCTVTVRNVSASYQGLYQIVFSNDLGEISFNFTVQLKAGQLRPRLVDGTEWSGRLEVCSNDTCSTVCGNNFKHNEAQVVCRMLGFPKPGAVTVKSDMFGEGLGAILPDRLVCTGTESSLEECYYGGPSYCGHEDDVGVICNSPGNLTVRVVKGRMWSGLLEVLYDGVWSTVCSRGFGHKEVQVVCKMLRLSKAYINSPHAVAMSFPLYFRGRDEASILFSDLDCDGTETNIAQCKHSGFYNHTCTHNDDISVNCAIDAVYRLAGTRSTRDDMGRLEIIVGPLTRQNNKGLKEIVLERVWSGICGNNYCQSTAKVICKQLGYPSGKAKLVPGSLFGRTTRFWITEGNCTGDETSMTACVQLITGYSSSCPTQEIGVVCSDSNPGLYILLDTTREDAVYPPLEGSNVSLKCEGTKPIHSAVIYTWTETAGGRPSGAHLIFQSLTRAYNGRQAKCEATFYYNGNYEKLSSEALTLQVYYKPLIRITSDSNTCQPQATTLNTCYVTLGQDVTLVCSAESRPTSVLFEWSKKDMATSEKLYITSANASRHEGLYTCTVTTKSYDHDSRLPLSASYIFTVIVQEPPVVLGFTANGEDNTTVIVDEDSNVSLSCKAFGKPTPNMVLISEANNRELIRLSQNDSKSIGKTARLFFFIHKIRCQNSGAYRCEAKNSVGYISRTLFMLVPCAPTFKDLEGQLSPVTVIDFERSFTLELISYPPPEVKQMYYGPVNETLGGQLEDHLHVTCGAKPFAPALVTCNIIVFNKSVDEVYSIVFKNDLGHLPFNFTSKILSKYLSYCPTLVS